MGSVSHTGGKVDETQLRAARLAAAYEEIADVLEAVDLETEPELADALIDAVEATDEAYRIETWDDEGVSGARSAVSAD